MLAENSDYKTILKESQRLYKNISRRIKNIMKYGDNLPQYAVHKWKEFKDKFPERITKRLEPKKLVSIYRDLKYINALKTSTIKGAKRTQKVFVPVKEKLNVLSKSAQDKFWDIYSKLYEHTATMERFKYELFDTIVDYTYKGTDEDKAVIDIIRAYDQSLMQMEGAGNDEQIRLLFTSKLEKLLQ